MLPHLKEVGQSFPCIPYTRFSQRNPDHHTILNGRLKYAVNRQLSSLSRLHFYMYVCIYAHVCIWGCPHMCTYMWRPWVNVRYLSILFSTLVSETESGARQLGKASWPVTLGSLLPLSPSTGMKGKATMPSFCTSAKRQNSVLRQQAFYRPSHLPCILLHCDRASHNQSQGLVA